MDFKAQLAADMRVFHNPAEFATVAGFYYDREWYEVPVVLDHEAAAERQRPGGITRRACPAWKPWRMYHCMIWASCRSGITSSP